MKPRRSACSAPRSAKNSLVRKTRWASGCASALALFNTESLFRVLVEARTREALANAKTLVRDTIRDRHEGEDDVTIITQDAVLATFDRILRALTLTVAGIAAISLAVAGILIMNVMLVAVSQRTAEIGLLKALGASAAAIQRLFVVALATGLAFSALPARRAARLDPVQALSRR